MPPALRAVVLAGLLAAGGAHAADEPAPGWELDATIPAGAIAGDTTYRIFASDGLSSIESELEFPLQGVLAGLHLRLASPGREEQGRWVLEGAVLHTLTEATGTLEDSDWIDGLAETAPPPRGLGLPPNPGKDIFSTSKAFLRALVLEARVGRRYAVAPSLRLTPLAGVLYQRFSYDVIDVNQVGNGPYASEFTVRAAGRVLDYEARYRALYLGGRGELGMGAFSAALEAWYSPFATASDRDDHLLRGKLSEIDADGSAWQVALEAHLALGPADALVAHASLVRFSATGKQHQRFYAGPDQGESADIDARIRSSRLTVGVAWTHGFRF